MQWQIQDRFELISNLVHSSLSFNKLSKFKISNNSLISVVMFMVNKVSKFRFIKIFSLKRFWEVLYKKGGNICFSFCRYISSYIKLYGPFLWMGFNCLKATATSRRQFTFYHWVPRYSGTHFIDLGRMKGWVDLGATQWFWSRDSWIRSPAP